MSDLGCLIYDMSISSKAIQLLNLELCLINAEKLAMQNCGCLPEGSLSAVAGEWMCWGMLITVLS